MSEEIKTPLCDFSEQARLKVLQEIVEVATHVYDLRDAVEHIYHYDGKPIVVLTEKAFYALFANAEYEKRAWEYDSYKKAWERSLRYELPVIVFRTTERRPAEMTAPED